ncbi:MAG TPA: hypothetical protein VGS41_13800, partial [Chthonomonadales bacterium]|nr:hypothetical protein [Chthonomonadales bacterium]
MKVSTRLILAAIAPALILLQAPVSAQFGGPKFLKISASAPKAVFPGRPFQIAVTLHIDKPF